MFQMLNFNDFHFDFEMFINSFVTSVHLIEILTIEPTFWIEYNKNSFEIRLNTRQVSISLSLTTSLYNLSK